MTTVSLTFPGPLSTKRRRMRSGGNVSVTINGVNGGDHVVGSSTSASLLYHNNNTDGGMLNGYDTNSNHNKNYNNTDDSPHHTEEEEENISEQKTTQTSKCKGATTIPIFLKKTYKLVDTCDPSIASWTDEGDMFVVKDPDLFATQVIPQYFDHNKFSSFARQLNFYGFRKMQSKPIRNSDYDATTSKHVTFFNENFKRGRCDLLKKIQRSTRGGGTTTPMDQSREVALLREQVANLEQQISEVSAQTEERVRRLELEMLSRLEQMMLTVQQQQRTQFQLEKATSIGSIMSSQQQQQQQHLMSMPAPPPQHHQPTLQQQLVVAQQLQSMNSNSNNNNAWDNGSSNNPYNNVLRASSISSAANSVANIVGNQVNFLLPNSSINMQQQQQVPTAPPTLPPHPKQKQLPNGIVPGGSSMAAPPDRLNSLRGISTLSRGFSGLTRGASVESSASAVLMRNSWEDKFFSMLMLEGNDNILNNNNNSINMSPTPIGGPVTISESSEINMNDIPTMTAISSSSISQQERMKHENDDDLSDVSSGDLP